ncbi:hypothetical protein COY23_03725 [bacterium (Candidatus Torokbacteria) CG_4_10_14_0_2_um_filter_35_8]|nr:MAG: hypothetical protein COY23_03725 [bacterium (Candidatus Torokbacteria) CG_4_10_14_0_2_um_filter_35_8]
MKGFSTKKVAGETLGEILRKKREQMKLSIERLALRTNIQPRYIKYLEENKFHLLPPPIYVKGFLKSCTKCLKIDEKEILSQYEKELELINKKLEKQNEGKIRTRVINPWVVINPRNFTIFAGILIFILCVSYLVYQVSNFGKPPKLIIERPKDEIEIDGDKISIVGETEIGAMVFINDQPIFVDRQGRFKEEIVLQDGINIIKIKAVNRIEKETTEVRKVNASLPQDQYLTQEDTLNKEVAGSTTEKEDLSGEQSSKETKSNTKGEELVLEVRIGPKAAWIYVEEDGKLAYQGTMLPQTSQVFKAKEGITLTTGRAESTQVIFNGQDLGKLGKEGEVIRGLEFTHDLDISQFKKD